MKKSDTNSIFWLGHCIGAFAQALDSGPTGNSLLRPAYAVQNNLRDFIAQKELLPASRNAAQDFVSGLDKVYVPRVAPHEVLKGVPRKPLEDALSRDEVTVLFNLLYGFQSTLSSELPQANIYYVTPKCAYDTAVLMNNGERVLPEGILETLSQSREKVLNDLRQATKCLAVSIPTAVGFHIYRAIEAIIVDEYFPLLEIEKSSNRNLGEYIKLLKQHGVDEKVTAPLFHIKNHYRNPISHPEEFWDQTKANGAFGLAVSIIIIMSQDIASRKPEPSTDSKKEEKS